MHLRRSSVVTLAGIGLLVVVLSVLTAIPLLRGDDSGTQGTLVGPLSPARIAQIVEALLGPA